MEPESGAVPMASFGMCTPLERVMVGLLLVIVVLMLLLDCAHLMRRRETDLGGGCIRRNSIQKKGGHFEEDILLEYLNLLCVLIPTFSKVGFGK